MQKDKSTTQMYYQQVIMGGSFRRTFPEDDAKKSSLVCP
jgi:hypothetical protein